MNEEPAQGPKKKSNRTSVIIALLSIIIIIQGVKIFYDSRAKQDMQAEQGSTEEELASTIQRLNEIQSELDVRIDEINKLGGDVEDLKKAKQEITDELSRTKRASGKVISELKDKVDGYEELLRMKDQEIEHLKSVNKQLFSENNNLKTQKNQLGDSLNRLSQATTELQSKVAVASRLKAENITIVGLTDKGKERDSPFRARQIAKVKVDFNIAENNVAPIEGKKIIIRIVDENGQVIFDVDRGSGTFIYNGREEFYTAAQEILFDNSRQHLTFTYDKGSDYPPGNYTMEVYCDDYQMGSGQFTVK